MANVVPKRFDKKDSGGFRAVRAVSLDIADGEFMVLVGPSGCGKSTALTCLCRFDDSRDVTQGELYPAIEVTIS